MAGAKRVGTRAHSIDRARLSFNAGKPRLGRVHRACRHEFIASDGAPQMTAISLPAHSRAWAHTAIGCVTACIERCASGSVFRQLQ
jgi:hypothetical protein